MPQPKGTPRLPFDGKKRDSADLRRDLPSPHVAVTAGALPRNSPPSWAEPQVALEVEHLPAHAERAPSHENAPSGSDDDSTSHAAQRDAARRGLRLGETAPLSSDIHLTRQLLRSMGFNEIRRRCRNNFPRYNRREINQLARKLHDEAWKNRDHEAIKALRNG